MAKHIDKQELASTIRNLQGLSAEQKSALLELLNEKKQYGLVWENHEEDVEELLRVQLPVLTEVPERRIMSEDKDAPDHIIIEGDNLHALTSLCYTHEGKIDVIYIDPPYNTGNKDFIYNDSFVDAEDSYRHSKWLSFMEKRLRIAHKLLSDRGVIFISIDDNELSNLTLLCVEIFGSNNQIAILPTIMNLKGNQDEFGFAGTHEYTIVFAKNKSSCSLNEFPIDESELESWDEDGIGYFKKGATLKRTGEDAPREERPFGYFPILINKETLAVSTIKDEEYSRIYNKEIKSFDDDFVEQLCSSYSERGFEVLLPTIGNVKASWRWGFSTVKKNIDEIIVSNGREGFALYKKQRPELGELPTKKPKTLFYKAQYSSGNGTQQILDIFKEKKFSNPKPINLIQDFLTIGSSKDSILLDFFAGSGTTLHATMQLNAEDGGHRQCILVTNNENDICEAVTYERNKRAINGYSTQKGIDIEGLSKNNLRYFKTEFVLREKSNENKRRLVHAATGLLCIKENLFNEIPITLNGRIVKKTIARHFQDDCNEMLVIYEPRLIPYIVEELKVREMTELIKVYVFSEGQYAYNDDFKEVLDKVNLCALPEAIYQAYQKVLPKRKSLEEISFEASESEIEEALSEADTYSYKS